MTCQRCQSNRIITISGKCCDSFSAVYNDQIYDDYVLGGIGCGGGDYIEMEYCLECGQIQGDFPKEEPEF